MLYLGPLNVCVKCYVYWALKLRAVSVAFKAFLISSGLLLSLSTKFLETSIQSVSSGLICSSRLLLTLEFLIRINNTSARRTGQVEGHDGYCIVMFSVYWHRSCLLTAYFNFLIWTHIYCRWTDSVGKLSRRLFGSDWIPWRWVIQALLLTLFLQFLFKRLLQYFFYFIKKRLKKSNSRLR